MILIMEYRRGWRMEVFADPLKGVGSEGER